MWKIWIKKEIETKNIKFLRTFNNVKREKKKILEKIKRKKCINSKKKNSKKVTVGKPQSKKRLFRIYNI